MVLFAVNSKMLNMFFVRPPKANIFFWFFVKREKKASNIHNIFIVRIAKAAIVQQIRYGRKVVFYLFPSNYLYCELKRLHRVVHRKYSAIFSRWVKMKDADDFVVFRLFLSVFAQTIYDRIFSAKAQWKVSIVATVCDHKADDLTCISA